jgi:ATP-dependent Lhr-like helicase
VSAFDFLHPAIQHHIVNSLGWRTLRALQEEAVQPILDGESALLIAPTAGGKTEAAVFPLLSRLLSEHWKPISVLYVGPIKALLNNLENRLRQSFTGRIARRRTAAAWSPNIRVA